MSSVYDDTRDATFGELYKIAIADPDVIVLSADTGAMMFKEFAKNIPDQFHNVGIAEQNAMSVAAGLALAGKHVFVFGISNFVTLRCFEQIKVDLCCMRLPVTILGMGVGYSYSSDGPTHHMIEDMSIMRSLPGMTIWCPSDCTMTAELVHLAYKTDTPSYIRTDKGPLAHVYDNADHNFEDGLAVLKEGKDLMIVATGIMTSRALTIVDELQRQQIDAGLVDLYRIKPINTTKLIDALKNSTRIVTLEENTVIGGIGSIVREILADNEIFVPVKVFGVPDKYTMDVGSRDMLCSLDGIDVSAVSGTVLEWVR